MGEWRKVKLNDVADYSKDRISSDRLTINNYVSTENMLPEKAGKTVAASLPTGNVIKFTSEQTLVSNIRPYFKKIWYATNDGGCSADVLAFNITEQIDSKYFYYLLSQDAFFDYMMAGSKGTKMPRGDKQQIMLFPFLLPPISKQKTIAETLSCLDDKIELNNKINANLEQTAQAIFKSWFVDFEPFGGVMPNDWWDSILGKYVDIKRGGSPRPIQDFLSDNGLRWLKISDVTSLQTPFVLEIKEHIKESGLRKTVFLKSGSLVLSNSATPGIPKILGVDTCIHDGWLYFASSLFSNEYLYLFFKYIREELVALGNGSVFTNLKTDILKNYAVSVPAEQTRRQFDNLIVPLFREMEACTRESLKLTELRDSLLPRLMSGEIDVSQV